MRIAYAAKGDSAEWVSAASVDYLMYSGYVSLAAHWLQMEAIAVEKLASGSGLEEADFYTAKARPRLVPRTTDHCRRRRSVGDAPRDRLRRVGSRARALSLSLSLSLSPRRVASSDACGRVAGVRDRMDLMCVGAWVRPDHDDE